jgi:hypothetical protein
VSDDVVVPVLALARIGAATILVGLLASFGPARSATRTIASTGPDA